MTRFSRLRASSTAVIGVAAVLLLVSCGWHGKGLFQMSSTQLCYDIEGNAAPCSDVIASGVEATPITVASLPAIGATGGILNVSGSPGSAAIIGLGNMDGGNSSSIASDASSIQKAIQAVFGTVYGAVNPPKPGAVINPATGQPYSIGQQLQLSGLFSNPIMLILLIVLVIFAAGAGKRHSRE
jgi:hypothetical protein